jgi:4-nitrophenyl phosphatase
MPKDKKVYVIGQAGLEEELDKLDIARCGGTVRPLAFTSVLPYLEIVWLGEWLMARTQKIEYLSKVWTGRPSSLIPRSELFYAGSTHMSVSLSSRLLLVQLRRKLTPDYKKYCKAYSYLRDNEGCHFLLTNQDKVFPTHGTTWPGRIILLL